VHESTAMEKGDPTMKTLQILARDAGNFGLLEEADGLAHGGLDVERLDVLPVLLEERYEEIDAQHDVGEDLILGHLDVADSNTQAKNLLELELDRRLNFDDLVAKILSVTDGGGELAGLGQAGTEETRNLLDERLGRQESIILLGELLDKLLVLVELLQVIGGHVLQLDLLGAINIGSICENAKRQARTRDVGELDGSRETLITLGIVVLEANLELDSLNEVAALLAGVGLVE